MEIRRFLPIGIFEYAKRAIGRCLEITRDRFKLGSGSGRDSPTAAMVADYRKAPSIFIPPCGAVLRNFPGHKCDLSPSFLKNTVVDIPFTNLFAEVQVTFLVFAAERLHFFI